MTQLYRFKVQLQGIRPPIWRRFLLPVTASFADLHEAIQDSCGWEDCHLHTFLQATGRRAELSSVTARDGEANWAATPLASWFETKRKERRRCLYWYDFGDDWMHLVELEAIEEHPAGQGRTLLAGARAFPPEDCGGIPGYQRCTRAREHGRSRAAAAAEADEVDDELLDWLGDWQPERFDLEAERRRFDRRASSGSRAKEKAAPRAASEVRGPLVARPLPTAPTSLATNQVLHLQRIATAASTHPVEETVTTALACIRRPGRRRCPGRIMVTRLAHGDEIEWACSDCTDGGFLGGWSGGACDLSGAAAAHARRGEEEVSVRIPLDVYGALIDVRNLAIAPSRLLYSARASAGQVELLGDLDELEELYEATCADANHCPPGKHGRRLDAACEVLASVLEAAEPPDRGEEAIVEAAARGLALTEEERNGLRLLCHSTWSLFSRIGGATMDRFADRLRETAEALVLAREIREALVAQEVEPRSLSLSPLHRARERVVEFGRRYPSGGVALCRQLLNGVGELAERVHPGGNELADLNTSVVEVALEMAGRVGAPSDGQRPLIVDLLELWLADRCGAFHFVPDLLAELKLGKREGKWLRRQIEERLGEGEAGDNGRLEALRDRLP